MEFIPYHIHATKADFSGNQDIGRYVFLPGSNGRAKEIAMHFENHSVKEHPRGHDIHFGSLKTKNGKIDVAAIGTGMGCGSMEIILHELFQLGAKRFLRVGTCGGMQPNLVKFGDIIHATGSVRDEKTTRDYLPIEVPALSSHAFYEPIFLAAKKLSLQNKLHSGLVHCKSSLYAREFGEGPLHLENERFKNILSAAGVLASEMETAALFIQSQIYHHSLQLKGNHPSQKVYASALLGVITTSDGAFTSPDQTKIVTENLVALSVEAMKTLAEHEAPS